MIPPLFGSGVELDLESQNGSIIYWETSPPLYEENGEVRGSMAVYLDITERKVAERERHQFEERMPGDEVVVAGYVSTREDIRGDSACRHILAQSRFVQSSIDEASLSHGAASGTAAWFARCSVTARSAAMLSEGTLIPNGGSVAAAKATLSAAGAYAPPEKTGTASVVAAAASVALQETCGPPTKIGATTVTGPAATSASSSTYTPPAKTGIGTVAARRPAVGASGEMIRILPPPSGVSIRVVNWLQPAS